MERPIISFDYAILRDKANFDILNGFLTELLEKPVTVQEVLESEVIPFSQNLNPNSDVPKGIHPEYFMILPKNFLTDEERKRKNKDFVPQKPTKAKFDEWVYVLKHSVVKSEFTAKGIQAAGDKLNLLNMTPEERAYYEPISKRWEYKKANCKPPNLQQHSQTKAAQLWTEK